MGFKAANSFISASLQLSQKHKVGVLLCRAGQSTEEEMYNNEEASPAFSAFLELLGEQVLLKGFTKYAAQLDTKSESCQELHLNLGFLLYITFMYSSLKSHGNWLHCSLAAFQKIPKIARRISK